jgi:protein SCO1/2
MTGPGKTRAGNEERLFLGLIIGLVLVAGIGAWGLTYALSQREQTRGLPPDRVRTLADFSLTNTAGQTVTRADLHGKILVVSFLFTSCSLTCPEVTKHMAEIQRLTAGQPDVRLVSLTVDPRDDTLPVLAKYGQRFAADTNRWQFLTGDKTVLYHLITTSFLKQDLDDPFSYMPGNFSHTERLAVVDPHGRVTAYFDGLRDDVATVVAAEITRLRQYAL